jgi:Tfp pilus assembly protein PilZ
MANKRKEDRLVERNNVSIKPFYSARSPQGINAYTQDLSLGGARIYTKEFYDIGSAIKVQIELADTQELIVLDGIVKWLTAKEDGEWFDLGVEFHHRISNSVLCLIKHLYQQESKIPTTIA